MTLLDIYLRGLMRQCVALGRALDRERRYATSDPDLAAHYAESAGLHAGWAYAYAEDARACLPPPPRASLAPVTVPAAPAAPDAEGELVAMAEAVARYERSRRETLPAGRGA